MTNKKVVRVNMNVLSAVIVDSINNNSDVKLTVTGNSMYPLFRGEVDSVLLTASSINKKYDIPLYKRDSGEYILHRIVKVESSWLYLAGDNEIDIEFPVYPHQVVATVKGFYRNGKYTSCNNVFYQLYSFFWVLILPNRFKVLWVLKKLQFIMKSLRRKCCGK